MGDVRKFPEKGCVDMPVKENKTEIQTRSEVNGLRFYRSLSSALADAQKDTTVWKVSFCLPDGERVRLIRTDRGWTYEDVTSGERFI